MDESREVTEYDGFAICPYCNSLFTLVVFQGFPVKLRHCGWCGGKLKWPKGESNGSD